ncbi:MAG: trypsin-like peptidase domain-containing protein [Nanoarchaeota archaeon]|nr:trypsin-like peptidase domain-containing protein [Nanoarchaeota archaeon]
MALQKKHKIMIGSVSSIIVIVLIINSIFLYFLFVKVNTDYSSLNSRLIEMQADTQSKINELTENLADTEKSLGNQLSELKASASSDFSGIIEDSIPAVVTIKTDVAQGTGFIITSDGYIVTNAHVLVGGRKVWAITSEQKTIEADFVGYDIDLDIALLKVPGAYSFLELGNSDNIQVGEKVIAIGNPLGLQFSVSEGIISATDRPGSNGEEAYIQTDAALNPGNSGGPLIDTKGKAIGINNFKVSGSENLGFALESNYIKNSVNAISQQELQKDLL